MKKLSALLFTLLLTANIFATTIYVSNKTSSEVINGAYAARTGYDSYYTDNLLNTYVRPGEYSGFVTNYYDTSYTFKITTTSGNQCIVSRYVGTQPLVIWYYYDSGRYRCYIEPYN